jgi:hypothetical protein
VITVSIVNQSVMLRGRDFSDITRALGKQLFRDFLPVYGIVPSLQWVPLTAVEGLANQEGNAFITILDTPDVPDVYGYHWETPAGEPYAKVFCEPIILNGGSLQSTANSVSCVLSHELLEMVADSAANRWADNADAMFEHAYEVCDAVEADHYFIDDVAVSNFVYPAFFDSQADSDSKYDFLGNLTRPFSMTTGGYQIVRDSMGIASNIFAEGFPEWKKACKRSRRLA